MNNDDTYWNIRGKLGCFDHLIRITSALRTVMKASISLRGEFSVPVEIGRGMEESCVLASTQFPTFLSMTNTFDDPT